MIIVDRDLLSEEIRRTGTPKGEITGGMMIGIGTDATPEKDTMTGIGPLEETGGLPLGIKTKEGGFIPHQGLDLIQIRDENTLLSINIFKIYVWSSNLLFWEMK